MLTLDGERLYVLQGFAPRAEQAAWLPRFRELAQSFRRLPAGDGPGAAAAGR